jgi:hypothetical protein
MVRVKSIAEMGAYVSLLEYNGIEGAHFFFALCKVCALLTLPGTRHDSTV